MFRLCLFFALLLVSTVSASAADDATKTVTDALHSIVPKAKIDSIAESSLPGYYSVVVDGHVLYVSVDGKYLIEGMVYDLPGHRDLNQDRLAGIRKQGVTKIAQDKRLVFAPPHPKFKVIVFTDVDCPYCRTLHKQIAEYNKLGIEVDYVLFPLNIHPGADRKAETVWCSKDRNSAYTAAMNGENIPVKTCENPVAELTAIAMAMGVTGTPAIIAEDGSQLGGYLPPSELAQRLESLAAPPKPATAM